MSGLPSVRCSRRGFRLERKYGTVMVGARNSRREGSSGGVRVPHGPLFIAFILGFRASIKQES